MPDARGRGFIHQSRFPQRQFVKGFVDLGALDQLDAEYDVTVEAARQKIIDARKAGASK